jgi:hypothetical protein
MFLCDVPLFVKQLSATENTNIVRLMGTVVEIIRTSPLHPSGIDEFQSTSQTLSTTIDSTHTNNGLIHFVIDDGTDSIGVFTKIGGNKTGSDCTMGESFGNSLPTSHQNNVKNPLAASKTKNANQNHYSTTANQPSGNVSPVSILNSQPPPILPGQTVDCIGRIEVDIAKNIGVDSTNHDEKKMPRIWVAAASVSIVKNPQEVTLRQIEMSSTKRRKIISDEKSERGIHNGRSINSQNRILVGGLERKLNPLFHCKHTGSVVFNIEAAFNYIKHSRDDGGITSPELALLVGAMEPNEMLAVNLAVGQLREDCRIYLNQGKWFPM